MNLFRTVISLDKQEEQMSFNDKLMFIGSCFTENIGNKMQNLLFKTDINPFGIIYNPFSTANSLRNLINNKTYNLLELLFHNELWHSLDHHGCFSNSDKKLCLENINKRTKASSEFLKQTNYLFITFGTAFVYTQKKSGEIVANCHKLPNSDFNRELLEVETIVKEYNDLINILNTINPNIKIVFTISPVRHWKDGAEQNNLSKSILKLSINEISKYHQNVFYFPAYEIMMDDLRDYRFYKDDMLHPNTIAIEYIWNKFSDAFFSDKTLKIISEIEKIIKASKHRPINPIGNVYKDFVKLQLNKIDNLGNKYPDVDIKDLKQKFK